MILYFSGTGNSKYVAQRMAEALNQSLLSMNDRIRSHDTEGPYGTVMEQDVLDGMVLPDPNRRHWFARHAAEAWVRDARLLGAECHIETGRIEWAVTP